MASILRNVASIHPRVGVTLCMIVKNESHVIRRCLESAKPLIDSWAIMDTGSTDGTQDIIRECLKDIPGTLGECEWNGFSDARNKSLDLACSFPSKFLLMMDADEVISGDLSGIREELICGNILVFGKDNIGRPRASVLRNGLDWKYIGRVHEYPVLNGKICDSEDIASLSIHTDSSGSRHHIQNWILGDIGLLSQDLLENPKDGRNCYLMGVMLKAAGMAGMAEVFVKAGKEYEEAIS